MSLPCSWCPGEGERLGMVGILTWYRCRSCGLWFSSGPTEEDVADDQDA